MMMSNIVEEEEKTQHDDYGQQQYNNDQYGQGQYGQQQQWNDQQQYGETNGNGNGSLLFQTSQDSSQLNGDVHLPDGFAPVPSLPMVYKWMVSSIGESMSQAMPMPVRVSMPLDSIQSISQGISLRNPSQADEIWKNLWITAHTRHFHGVIVLGWAKMQQNEACNAECCPKMIVGKTEVRWKQSPEELASYEDGDPYKVTYLSLPAAEYIDRSLAENHGILSESSITPFVNGVAQPGVSDYEFSFSSYFIPTMKEVYKYIMRVYTHLYLYHVDLLPATFSNFIAPPLPDGAVPAAQKELEKFSFHLAYFLNFGLSFHLITHEQIESLGPAMKYFIWNLPDMEDQVPATFKQMIAQGGGVADQQFLNFNQQQQYQQPTIGLSAPANASSNPFLQSTNVGSMQSNQFNTNGQMMLPGANVTPNGTMTFPNGFTMDPQMMMQMMQMMNTNGQLPPLPTPPVNQQNDEIRKLQEEIEALRLEKEKIALEKEKEKQRLELEQQQKAAVSLEGPADGDATLGAAPATNGFASTTGKTASNIDPQLIALKRAELIKKSIAPFIAHNLAIAKVEQDLKESNFPPDYVPSPGYGPNGYLLVGGKPPLITAKSTDSLDRDDLGNKVLTPSERERGRSKADDGSSDNEGSTVSMSGNKKSKSKGSRNGKKRRSGEGSDSSDSESESEPSSKSSSSHSRPDATLLGANTTTSNSPSTSAQPAPGTSTTAAGKKPVPRRPIPNKNAPPPGREPSCGQRLCFTF